MINFNQNMMGTYIRGLSAKAYQIQFSDEDKDNVKKGIPATAFGDHIKLSDGVFQVAIHLGQDAKLANEGDWVVEEEGGNRYILSDAAFHDQFTKIEQSADEGADESDGHDTTIDENDSEEADAGDMPSVSDPGSETAVE